MRLPCMDAIDDESVQPSKVLLVARPVLLVSEMRACLPRPAHIIGAPGEHTEKLCRQVFRVEVGRGILPSPLVTYPKIRNIFVFLRYIILSWRPRDGTQHAGKNPHPETGEDDSDVSADDPLRGPRPRDVLAFNQSRATSAGNRLRNLECGSQPQTPAATQSATLDRPSLRACCVAVQAEAAPLAVAPRSQPAAAAL